MKQLHVVGSYPNGTHTFVLWQLMGAHALGYQTAVLAANTGNDSGYQLAKQLGLNDRNAIYLNYRNTSPWRLDIRRFRPAIVRAANSAHYGRVLAERRKAFFCDLLSNPTIKQAELVQVHFTSWAIEVGIPLAKLLNRPCVVTAHGAVARTPVESLRYVQESADAVVVVSDSERRAWIDRTGSDQKLHWVWNGLPINQAQHRAREQRGRPLELVTIGRLSPEKRISDVVVAVAQLRSLGYDCRLTIFGEGELRGAIETQIRQLGLAEWIILEGVIPHENVMEKLASTDVLIHASETETFGLALIEGMAAGLPVVAAHSNGASEIVIHGTTGFLYTPGDVSKLVEHIVRLADDANLSATMGCAGRRRVDQEFSLEAHMRNMERVWQAAMGGHAENNPACHYRNTSESSKT